MKELENKNTIKKNPLSFQLDLSKFESVSKAERLQQTQMHPSTTFFKDGMKRLLKNKIAMTSLVVIVLITLIAIFAPFFYPYSYEQMNLEPGANNLRPFQYSPSELQRIAEGQFVFPHIFGTDAAGRDYAIRVIYGTRISLAVGFFASIIVLIIGMIYGAVSGYLGGTVDIIMMRIVDIIYSLPDMLLIILLSVVIDETLDLSGTPLSRIGTGMISIFVVFGLLYWVGMARLIRGQVLSLKEQEFVLAARSIGAKPAHIIRKHLLPNSMSVIIISTALQIPSAIFTESFLSFLGLGVEAPMPSLGSLASAALDGIYSYPYRLIIPAIVISLIVMAFNLLGDGLRDAFDPRLKR
ncbi:MAG TPA: ABC transporter permease [Clostridia bacterium]